MVADAVAAVSHQISTMAVIAHLNEGLVSASEIKFRISNYCTRKFSKNAVYFPYTHDQYNNSDLR